jgi:hypothetical protein
MRNSECEINKAVEKLFVDESFLMSSCSRSHSKSNSKLSDFRNFPKNFLLFEIIEGMQHPNETYFSPTSFAAVLKKQHIISSKVFVLM